jgi:hypothetical protein
MRSFEVIRQNDETGISGTGKVIEGIIFSDGECVVRWMTEKSLGRCVSIWPNFGSFLSIHVYPHPSNNTQIMFSDGAKMIYEDGAFVERPAPRERRKKVKVKVKA